METNSSGEDLLVKTRKPYTITKQREKWTEEEHNKFIEALKLYGRAWQRIEEHIGTKTAVQIRSHAQKFFTKLEKEAVTKGVPFGQAHDIEIPPPRPKRKPSSPYPRKTGAGFFTSTMEPVEEKTSKSPSPLSVCKQATDTENSTSWKMQGMKDSPEDGSCSEVLNLFQDTPAASISSFNKGPSNSGAFKGFMPLEKEIKGRLTFTVPSLSIEVDNDVNKDREGNNSMANTNHDRREFSESCIGSQAKPAEKDRTDTSKQQEKYGPLLINNLQCGQNHVKNVSVDFLKRSDGNEAPADAGQGGSHSNAKPSLNPSTPSTSCMNTNSGISSIHDSFPSFPPFNQFPSDQDAYRSFLNISSSFSSLIVSTLLQNPAAHAAATMAASFWPAAGVDSSIDSSSKTPSGGLPARHMNPSPSLAAIAAATVAAASAWWAAQGLLPVYPPLHAGFAFGPAPTTSNPAGAPNNSRKGAEGDTFQISVGINQQVIGPEHSEAVRAPHPSSKSLASTSSDSDESARGEHEGAKNNKFLSSDGAHDIDKAANVKKLDRSSCGSNISSEAETDVAAKKNDEDKEEANEVHLNNPPSGDTNIRRLRNNGSMNESWKEVSEEGRVAFRALFGRGVLPQSFSPPHAKDSPVMTARDRETSSEMLVDLNEKALSEPTDLYLFQGFVGVYSKDPSTSEDGNGKLKVRRTGFKPYKRCSVEAKESISANGDEASNKRIRLEGETSI